MEKSDFQNGYWFVTRYDKYHGIRIMERDEEQVISGIEHLTKYGQYATLPTRDTPDIVKELLSITGVNSVVYDNCLEVQAVRFISINSFYREEYILDPVKFVLSKHKDREPVLF